MPNLMLKFPDRAEPVSLACQIEGDQFEIRHEDAVYTGSVVFTGPGAGWLNYERRIIPFYVSRKQDELSIWLEGNSYALSQLNPDAMRRGAAGSPAGLPGGEVKAPMPGTILNVLVQVGDTVEANQPLVLMESMKMEMTLSSPQAAVVKEVRCTTGQLVDMGSLLVQLEVSK
jgi:biotin carboxyl carrier protein